MLRQGFELLDSQHAVLPLQRPGRDAVDLRVAALLVVVDVRLGLADHGLARSAMESHTDQVRHRAGRDEQGRLFAEQFGQAVLELDHRGVFAPDVVANGGRGHGGAHRRSGTGDRVAAEIFGSKRHGCGTFARV